MTRGKPLKDDLAIAALKSQLDVESSDSRSVLESPEKNPVCSINIDNHIPCLVVIWQRYATSAQLRFINEHILLLLREHGFQRILSDHSELQTIHADDQKWIIESWLPRAVDAGLRAAAAKKSAHHFGQLAVDLIRRSVQREIALRSFDTIDEARAWLRTAG